MHILILMSIFSLSLLRSFLLRLLFSACFFLRIKLLHLEQVFDPLLLHLQLFNFRGAKVVD